MSDGRFSVEGKTVIVTGASSGIGEVSLASPASSCVVGETIPAQGAPDGSYCEHPVADDGRG